MMDFNNTQIAFAHKSPKELRNANLLFNVMKRPWIVSFGKWASNIAIKVHFPISWIVKPTIYKQFVGGEALEDCDRVIAGLEKSGVFAALDYSAECKQTPEGNEAVYQETLRSIDNAARNKRIVYAVFKPSTLTTDEVLAKSSEAPETMTAEEKKEYEKFVERFMGLCQRAYDNDVRILVDAEDVCFQVPLDKLTDEAMRKYNKKRAIVFATLQMYRHDRLPYLEAIYKDAVENDYIAGIKFVRGAYMEEERKRAAEKGYPDPICKDKPSTDANFDAGVEYVLNHIDRMELFIGTHNEDSCYKAARIIDEKGIERGDTRIYFAQLHGMSDHITFNLADAGYGVLKYVPYAKVKDVLPYLIRRAEENTSVEGQTLRELTMIKTEKARRKEAK